MSAPFRLVGWSVSGKNIVKSLSRLEFLDKIYAISLIKYYYYSMSIALLQILLLLLLRSRLRKIKMHKIRKNGILSQTIIKPISGQ